MNALAYVTMSEEAELDRRIKELLAKKVRETASDEDLWLYEELTRRRVLLMQPSGPVRRVA